MSSSSASVNVSDDLKELYEDYFDIEPWEARKNKLAADDTARSIRDIVPNGLGKCIDYGAGDGVVLQALDEIALSDDLSAVEISSSGLRKINNLNLKSIKHVEQFDGYRTSFADKTFDYAVCSHVLEHVEHERLVLYELRRIAKALMLVVPLEGGMRAAIDRRGGHINYYIPKTILNLLETSGFQVKAHRIFPSSATYEKLLYGNFKGSIRSLIRRYLLAILGDFAPQLMTYNIVVHCVPVRQLDA